MLLVLCAIQQPSSFASLPPSLLLLLCPLRPPIKEKKMSKGGRRRGRKGRWKEGKVVYLDHSLVDDVGDDEVLVR